MQADSLPAELPGKPISGSYIILIYIHTEALRHISRVSLVAQVVKNLPAMQNTQIRSLGWEDALEEEMATHSSILSWRIPWTVEPSRLESMGLQRVGCDWALSTFIHGQLRPSPRVPSSDS